jgi:hypothetical protein
MAESRYCPDCKVNIHVGDGNCYNCGAAATYGQPPWKVWRHTPKYREQCTHIGVVFLMVLLYCSGIVAKVCPRCGLTVEE